MSAIEIDPSVTAGMAAATRRGRRVLIVRGGWEGHQPVQATNLFLDFLRRQGFTVDIHDLDTDLGPTPYADAERMAGVDLIVQCVSMGTITSEQVAGLRAAVASGTGLAGWHGGIVDSFRNSFEYHQLIGGLFVAHPTAAPAGSSGAPQPAHRYTVVDHDHPITAAVEDFDLVTEQYWVLSDDYCDVLVTTTQAARPEDDWSRPVTSPAVWTRRWGRGRIFVATPGHSVDILEDAPVRRIIERGLLWAAGPD